MQARKKNKRLDRLEKGESRNIFELVKAGRGNRQRVGPTPAPEQPAEPKPKTKHKVVLRDPMVTFQVVPDRTARNWNTDDLTRALHELYILPLRRFTFHRVGWRVLMNYRPQEHITWDITMEPGTIRFWITVPARWGEYVVQKLQTIWPKATIKAGNVPELDVETSAAAELSLRKHNLFSLATHKNDNRPLNAIMEISKDVRDGDLARTQVFILPRDRQEWSHDALKAVKDHRDGKTLRRQDFRMGIGGLAKLGAEGLNAIFSSLAEQLTEFVSSSDEQKKPMDWFEYMQQKQERELSEATLRKVSEPVFSGLVRVAAHSKSGSERANFLVKGLANAYNDVAQDNEFKRRDVNRAKAKRRMIENMNSHKSPNLHMNYSVLGASELAKLLQVPGPELQDEYPNIEQVSMREAMLAKSVSSGGLWMGNAKLQGMEIPVYMPTNDVDRLCLPHVVIGGMGTGKTKGFGANLVVQAVRNGFGAVVIDPAKGELGDEVEKLLPPDRVVRIRFGQVPVALDWREAVHSDRARNRLANELVAFCDAASDEAGAQTVRYMRAAAKAVTGGRLSEVVALFMDDKYRKGQIPNMHPAEQAIWKQFDGLSPQRQAQIGMPVMNRLDIITGDDYLAECMDAPDGIDFVELLSKQYPSRAIILDIPKSELGPEGVDVLAAMVMGKLDVAMVLRETDYPVFIVQDEPHQYVKSARTWKSAAVESRKWHFSYVWMFHEWSQIPRDVAAIIKSALPHYHLYTSSKDTYRALAEEIAPFTLEEALKTPFHWAINVIRDQDTTVAPFLAHMAPPPSMQRGPAPTPVPPPDRIAAK